MASHQICKQMDIKYSFEFKYELFINWKVIFN